MIPANVRSNVARQFSTSSRQLSIEKELQKLALLKLQKKAPTEAQKKTLKQSRLVDAFLKYEPKVKTEETLVPGASKPIPVSARLNYFAPLKHEVKFGDKKAVIVFKGFDAKNVDFFCDFALRAAYYLGLPATGPKPLATKRETWTVNKAPFKYEQSKENFERHTHGRQITIWDAEQDVVDKWLAYIKDNSVWGVGVKANLFVRQAVKALKGLKSLDDQYTEGIAATLNALKGQSGNPVAERAAAILEQPAFQRHLNVKEADVQKEMQILKSELSDKAKAAINTASAKVKKDIDNADASDDVKALAKEAADELTARALAVEKELESYALILEQELTANGVDVNELKSIASELLDSVQEKAEIVEEIVQEEAPAVEKYLKENNVDVASLKSQATSFLSGAKNSSDILNEIASAAKTEIEHAAESGDPEATLKKDLAAALKAKGIDAEGEFTDRAAVAYEKAKGKKADLDEELKTSDLPEALQKELIKELQGAEIPPDVLEKLQQGASLIEYALKSNGIDLEQVVKQLGPALNSPEGQLVLQKAEVFASALLAKKLEGIATTGVKKTAERRLKKKLKKRLRKEVKKQIKKRLL